jgi:hypothetical protein
MGRLKVFCLAFLSVLVVGVMTAGVASAEESNLPDIHTALPGELYPIDLSGHTTGLSELVNESGGVLKGTEFSILLLTVELSPLGKALIDFLGVENVEKHKCHTNGDSEAAGAVLIPGAEFHLVFTNTSPLEVAGLILFEKFLITCNSGLFEISNTGPSTARVSVPTPEAGKEGDITFLNTASHCASRVTALQEIPYYFNDNKEEVVTTLLANPSGTGNKKSCEEIVGTTLVGVDSPPGSATMFTVLW